jgi:tyrosyl-tRNA synthetase
LNHENTKKTQKYQKSKHDIFKPPKKTQTNHVAKPVRQVSDKTRIKACYMLAKLNETCIDEFFAAESGALGHNDSASGRLP